MAKVLGLINTIVASKFFRALAADDNLPGLSVKMSQQEQGTEPQKNDTFKTGLELLYGGQGKTNRNANLGNFNAITGDDGGIINASTFDTTLEHEGLKSPRLEETNGEVTGVGRRSPSWKA
jgi:hypothetical protein